MVILFVPYPHLNPDLFCVAGRIISLDRIIQIGQSEIPLGNQKVQEERVREFNVPVHSMPLQVGQWLCSHLVTLLLGPPLVHFSSVSDNPYCPWGLRKITAPYRSWSWVPHHPRLVPLALPKVLHYYSLQFNHLLSTRILAINDVSGKKKKKCQVKPHKYISISEPFDMMNNPDNPQMILKFQDSTTG